MRQYLHLIFLELFYFILDTNNFNYYIEHNEIMNASVLLITYQVFSWHTLESSVCDGNDILEL